MNLETSRLRFSFALFLYIFSIATLADSSGIVMCFLDDYSDHKIAYVITDLDKVVQWPWIFEFQNKSGLTSKMSESEMQELLRKLPDTVPSDINECWSVNATALIEDYPVFQNMITNSSFQEKSNSKVQVFSHDLVYPSVSAGNRFALRRGYVVGIISLVLINNFFPQYLYIGFASLVACFLFPDYADALVDRVYEFADSLSNQGVQNGWGNSWGNSWGSGRPQGSSGTEPTTNVGYSSTTITGDSRSDKSISIGKSGNIHFLKSE